jgi:hypothetical protein
MGFRDADSVGRYCNLDVFFPIGHRQGLDTSKETLNRTAERVPAGEQCLKPVDRLGKGRTFPGDRLKVPS